MASETEITEIIEHVVLFNIKQEIEDHHPSKLHDMINALNSLITVDSVVYLTAGPILRTRSLPTPLKFTHILHARFLSRADLSDYFLSPSVISVRAFVNTICDDVMSVDWSTNLVGPTVPRPGSGIRFTIFKFEDDEGNKKQGKILEGLKKIKESLGASFEQKSFGVNNFCDDDDEGLGKGFSVASLAVFPDLNELDASEEYEDQIRSLINKNKISDDHVIVLDYVVPRFTSTTPTPTPTPTIYLS